MKISFAEDMRRIDASVAETYGLPALALMENAGAGRRKRLRQ